MLGILAFVGEVEIILIRQPRALLVSQFKRLMSRAHVEICLVLERLVLAIVWLVYVYIEVCADISSVVKVSSFILLLLPRLWRVRIDKSLC